MTKNLRVALVSALALFLLGAFTTKVLAHQPAIESGKGRETPVSADFYKNAVELKDPTAVSQAVYGRIGTPGEIDFYTFTAANKSNEPFEVLIPARPSNKNFRPSLVVIGKNLSEPSDDFTKFTLPAGYEARVIEVPKGERKSFFEPFSFEKLYHGNEVKIDLATGEKYYLAVFEPQNYTGDYSLALGTKEDFSGASFPALIGEVVKIKLGLVGGEQIPWMDIFGLFIFISGLALGIAAVMIIDLHSIFTKDYEWTRRAFHKHKGVKLYNWLGLVLSTVGATILYRDSGFSGVATFQAVIFLVLIVNALTERIFISPFLLGWEKKNKGFTLIPNRWRKGILLSIAISFLGWWSETFLLVWYLLITR
jgi:hypothetical protein